MSGLEIVGFAVGIILIVAVLCAIVLSAGKPDAHPGWELATVAVCFVLAVALVLAYGVQT